jgi:HSP20 family protein
MLWPEGLEDMLRVDEYREDDTDVIRAEIAGIDPEKDVEITVSDGVLHMEAHRREEEKKEGKDFYRRELRYGSFSRDLPLPEGATEANVKASYNDGILEVRVPVPKAEAAKAETKKIPVTKS